MSGEKIPAQALLFDGIIALFMKPFSWLPWLNILATDFIKMAVKCKRSLQLFRENEEAIRLSENTLETNEEFTNFDVL